MIFNYALGVDAEQFWRGQAVDKVGAYTYLPSVIDGYCKMVLGLDLA